MASQVSTLRLSSDQVDGAISQKMCQSEMTTSNVTDECIALLANVWTSGRSQFDNTLPGSQHRIDHPSGILLHGKVAFCSRLSGKARAARSRTEPCQRLLAINGATLYEDGVE